jgi:glutamyl-tRNA(Gln) amidotransferase E subunit
MTCSIDTTIDGIGLKCGLEIHYQLDTKTKLFCNCPVGLRNDPPHAEIIRHMRPTMSELGEYDGTALMEFKTRKEVHYQLHYDTVCTYEMDDTPPFPLNREALNIALEIAVLLNCQIADEIHVSRKQYLDGSIPTGFQRTIAVGVNGWIPFSGRRIGIIQLCLEEDACREVSDRGHVIVFRTDRLSTPLVEIITAPDMRTPEEAMEVDRELGRILRATGRVRRGIGTVRQDVNVSVSGGTRVEIKGVPRTGLIGRLVHLEAVRQRSLLLLRTELQHRGISGTTFSAVSIHCTELFRKTRSETLAGAVSSGGIVGAVKLCGFAGLLAFALSPNRNFGDELKGRVRVIACLDHEPVIFHTDMLPCNGGPAAVRENGARHGTPGHDAPSQAEWLSLRRTLGAKFIDAVVLVWGGERDVDTALSEIAGRAAEAITGIPNETRQVLKSGETDFERILPGPNRMYPDTDSAPIPIEEDLLQSVRANVAVSPSVWRVRYGRILHEELLSALIDSGQVRTFDSVYGETGCDPVLLAYTLTSIMPRIARSGVRVEAISRNRLVELFRAVAASLIPRDAIPPMLSEIADGRKPVQSLCIEYSPATEGQIRNVLLDLLSSTAPAAPSPDNRGRPQAVSRSDSNPARSDPTDDYLIGRAKERLGRHADGRRVSAILRSMKSSEPPGG